MRDVSPVNQFSLAYYETILRRALDAGYTFVTFRQACEGKLLKAPKKYAIIRHDVDAKPGRLNGILEVEEKLGIRSSNFVLVHDNTYSALAISVLPHLLDAERRGFEIGLHTNFVETATLMGQEPLDFFAKELSVLRNYFDVKGVACHRNIDYMYNSLPCLEANWPELRARHDLLYQAYEKGILDELTFVNEGLNPHLGWRGQTPEEVIASGNKFCLSTHPHWWHKTHAFED